MVDELDNMNLRTKEAGALLVRFGRAVGKSGLDKALQQLFSGFRSEGYLEQMKRNMLTKSDKLVRAVKAETIRVGKAFAETYGEQKVLDAQGRDTGRTTGGEALRFVMESAGDDVVTMNGLIEKMSTMNAEQQQALMAKLNTDAARGAGVSGELKDELYRLMRLAKGSREGASAADRQAAQEEMGAGGNIQSRFALIESVVGNRNINDLSVIAKEALGQFGVDKAQLEEFAKIQTTMKGQFTEAQRIEKERDKLRLKLEQGKITQADFDTQDKALTDAFKAMGDIGVEFDDFGNLVMKDTGMIVEDFSGFLSAQGSRLDERLPPAEHQKTQEQYLSEGVNATTSVFNVLNNTIASILNDISKGIYNMVSYFFTGTKANDQEKANRQEAIRIVGERVEALSSEAQTERDAIKAEKERLHDLSFRLDTMTQNEKQAYEQARTDLANRETALVELRARESRSREQLRTLQTNEYALKVGTMSTERMLRESGGEALETRQRTGAETGALGEELNKVAELFAPISDIIGGNTHRDLMTYLQRTNTDQGVSRSLEVYGRKSDAEG